MAERRSIISDRGDDMPVLLAQLERMGVQSLLDEHGPTHGNGVGRSLGGVSVVWLTHRRSEADHRLQHVAPWAGQRRHTLHSCTGQPVHPLDMGDARLAGVVEALSEETRWAAFDGALNRQLLRVSHLPPERSRLDSPTASRHGTVTADGLFQCGHSKDHRPDLPQVQVMVSALDPLGRPVATDVVPGQRARRAKAQAAVAALVSCNALFDGLSSIVPFTTRCPRSKAARLTLPSMVPLFTG
jgi:transposase